VSVSDHQLRNQNTPASVWLGFLAFYALLCYFFPFLIGVGLGIVVIYIAIFVITQLLGG
jgi:hypothetical protein